jgi:hypothetical protein
MFHLCILRASNRVCKGDPATEEKASEIYGQYPTGIFISERTKDFRKCKGELSDFFKVLRQKSRNYSVDCRWSFENKQEALTKLFYEARGAGHYISSKYGWTQL